MNTFFKDLSYGVRSLVKNPGFTLVAVLSLALGIGVNTTVFSLMDAISLRSLAVQNPDQIVEIATREAAGEPHTDFSYPVYAGLRDRNEALSGVVAYADTNFGLTAGNQTERIRGEFVSSNYFSVLGVQPIVGSGFAADDERAGAPRVAVISETLWSRLLGRDSAVLQKTVTLNGRTFSVVGVVSKRFSGILRGMQTDVWITLPHSVDFEGNPDRLTSENISWLSLAGRLKQETLDSTGPGAIDVTAPGCFEGRPRCR